GFWRLHFRMIANEPVVLVDEQFTGLDKALYKFSVGQDFAPDHLLWRTRDGGATLRLSEVRAGSGFALQPWVQWWRTLHGNWVTLYWEDSPDTLTFGARDAATWSAPGTADETTGVEFQRPDAAAMFSLRGSERKWMLAVLPKATAVPARQTGSPL